MCVLKKENFFIKEIFYNLFSLFDLFVKRFLIDSEYDMVLYYLKCFKQIEEDLVFLENGGSILFLNKVSLQQIVSEVVCLFERNNFVLFVLF